MNRKNVNTFMSFAFLIVIIYSAILPVFSLQNNASISSHGKLNYSEPAMLTPTPTPTPSPSPTPSPPYVGTNLAPMPNYWKEWGSQGLGRYLFIDNAVTHNGHSTLRMQADYSTSGSGRDGFIKDTATTDTWIPISPGDHIVFSCWMKLNAGNGLYNAAPEYSGSRIGIDFYDNNGIIGDTIALNGNPTQTNEEVIAAMVNWGDTTWELRTMDFIVRSTYSDKGSHTPKVPTGIIPWIQTIPKLNTGYAWFADCELYVNPTGGP